MLKFQVAPSLQLINLNCLFINSSQSTKNFRNISFVKIHEPYAENLGIENCVNTKLHKKARMQNLHFIKKIIISISGVFVTCTSDLVDSFLVEWNDPGLIFNIWKCFVVCLLDDVSIHLFNLITKKQLKQSLQIICILGKIGLFRLTFQPPPLTLIQN